MILSKCSTNGLHDTSLTAEKEYSVNFTERQKNFWLSLHYNGANSYLFINGVEIRKFKANDSIINAAPFCLENASKDFSVDNMKKAGLYGYVFMILMQIMTVLLLMIY